MVEKVILCVQTLIVITSETLPSEFLCFLEEYVTIELNLLLVHFLEDEESKGTSVFQLNVEKKMRTWLPWCSPFAEQ